MIPVLMPTMPYSSASATRQTRPMSRRVEIRGEAELGVVGQRDRLVLGLEAEQRRDRAEGLLARDHHRRSCTSVRIGRLEEACRRARGACRRPRPCAPLATRVGDVLLDLLDRRRRRSAGPASTPASMPLPTFSASTAAASFCGERVVARRPARGCGWRRRRSGRCCGTWTTIAPSTAASRSASSNTMNGALPPSSSDSFLTVVGALRHQHACRPRSSR